MTTTRTVPDEPMISRIKEGLQKDPVALEVIEDLRNKKQHSKRLPLAQCREEDGLLLVDDLVYIPDDTDLKLDILKRTHDHAAAGHTGRAKTYEIVTRDYYWPGMRKFIARYIDNCDTCARIKPVHHAPFGQLRSLQVPFRNWNSIAMDFITGLPKSGGADAILVVVDRLSKMAHFIPTNETITAKDLAKIYFDNIFKIHGLPADITSDRGSLFTSHFWEGLCACLNTKQNLSTAFHPQTDGQTERVNGILEQYLRAYCNYQQDNWRDLLTMAEFSYNNSVSETTKVSPFFANYGYHPKYEIQMKPDYPAKNKASKSEIDEYVGKLKALEEHLKSEMKYAQAAQAEQYNRSRIPTPAYQIGDEVWLLRRNIQTTRPSAKLDYKRLGRFKVTKRVSPHAYELELPSTMKIHPVFHVSLLEPARTNPIPGHRQEPPPPVIVKNHKEWEVEEISDSRFHRGGLQYLVKWRGYDQRDWEPPEHLANARSLINNFHAAYPNKPRPGRIRRRTAK
jgi:hypothetical protein